MKAKPYTPFAARPLSGMTPACLLGLALVSFVLVGCTEKEARNPLPPTLVAQNLVTDLITLAKPPGGRTVAPGLIQHERHLRARVEKVPPEGLLILDGRVIGNEDRGPEDPIGPVTFTARVDGEEVFRREMLGAGDHLKFNETIPVAAFEGRDVVVELRVDDSRAENIHGFYWHHATLEVRKEVSRPSRGEGRNLLFVVVDTLRADHTSLHGYERPTTPHLESLAEDSLVFDRAFAAASWTLPSTATLLTGLAPPSHGAIGGGQHHLKGTLELLPEGFAAFGITTFAASANPLVGPEHSFDQGFERFVHEPWKPAAEINAHFFDWLGSAQDYRWFAYLHYIDPHDPYDPPSDSAWVDPDYDGVFTDPELLNQVYYTVNWGEDPPVSLDDRDIQHLVNSYDGEIAYWDRQFGEVLDRLREQGLLDETIIVVTSDHGEEFFEHGMVKHGSQHYDESLHVPLLVRAPGRVQPGRHLEPVSLQGLYRATRQLMGVDEGPARPDDLLRLPEDAPVFAHTQVQATPGDPRKRHTLGSVHEGDLTYMRWFYDDQEHLYDLASDPQQLENLAESSPEEILRLRTVLEVWIEAETKGEALEAPEHIDPETLERLRSLGYVQ